MYGIVKIVVTAVGLMAFTEQLGRKWSLIIGSMGQAFAFFYIGINSAVHPPNGELDGNAIFAIISVYLFVVFYSFGKRSSGHQLTMTTKLTDFKAGVPRLLSSAANAARIMYVRSSWRPRS